MQRVFPVRSGILLVVSAAAFFVFLAYIVTDALEMSARNSAETSNVDKVTLFMRLVYPSIAADLNLVPGIASKPLLDPDTFARVDQKIRAFVEDTHIVKVKIFDMTGQVIYSANPAQVGEMYNEGTEALLHASRGHPFSDVTFRDTFLGYSGEMRNVAIVSSYLPVRDIERNIVGVAELYTERTEIFDKIAFAEDTVNAVLIMGFALLCAAFSWIVWLMYVVVRDTLEDQENS